jgi:Fe-Mn family superoxide dismutase
MYGPGFVWLVYTTKSYEAGALRKFFILRTYLAGSPLVGAHFRRQGVDMNTENSNSDLRIRPKQGDGLLDVTPVLCVSTWQHSWMFDWTVAGKEQFLEAWWNKIDWKMVNALANIDSIARTTDEGTFRKEAGRAF